MLTRRRLYVQLHSRVMTVLPMMKFETPDDTLARPAVELRSDRSESSALE